MSYSDTMKCGYGCARSSGDSRSLPLCQTLDPNPPSDLDFHLRRCDSRTSMPPTMTTSRTFIKRTLLAPVLILVSGFLFIGRDEAMIAASSAQGYWQQEGEVDFIDALWNVLGFLIRIFIAGYGIFALIIDICGSQGHTTGKGRG